ncbi:gluconokinase [Xanthobacter autotrophicus]|uniref:gluconokinase n=1 Tax=Xanthobacter autotrophicus TaxID=280 RepID=UPI00372C9D8D
MGDTIAALVVMGVSGCGKSSVGGAVAELAGARLIEGDSFHPAGNIAKMSAGVPLDDDDRAGWLARLGDEMGRSIGAGATPVLTCSALKLKYRDALRAAVPGLGFVFLDLTREMAARRVAERPGHFMPASLIDSQFAALERPSAEALTLTLDATLPLSEMADQVLAWWRDSAAPATDARQGSGPTLRQTV